MNTTLYIFRHSLATYSTQGYGDRILTASILPGEVKPIERMAVYLKDVKDSRNYSSSILRCRQTAEIITGVTGKQFLFDRRLNEYFLESFTQFRIRIIDFFEKEIKITQTPNILICTHGSVLAGIKHLVLENKFLKKNFYDYPLCGEMIIIKNESWDIISFNRKKGDL